MEKPLTHFDAEGRAHMVDISAKAPTARRALAEATVLMAPATLALILEGRAGKGDVLGTARLAGIMAAKQTASLIPLCHPLPLSAVALHFRPDPARPGIIITAEVATTAPTGVEMEALTAASIAALTIYDMVKAADRGMRITDLRLRRKEGGASGLFEAP